MIKYLLYFFLSETGQCVTEEGEVIDDGLDWFPDKENKPCYVCFCTLGVIECEDYPNCEGENLKYFIFIYKTILLYFVSTIRN